jgi:hypothetical protein
MSCLILENHISLRILVLFFYETFVYIKNLNIIYICIGAQAVTYARAFKNIEPALLQAEVDNHAKNPGAFNDLIHP